MIDALVVVIGVLGLPGLVPALVALPRSPVVLFAAPLIGALMAAVAVECELGIGGSLVMWYVIVAVIVNAAALWWLVARGPSQGDSTLSWRWSLLTAAVVIAALSVPLLGLQAPMIGYDANIIWLTHTLLVSGGHQALRSGLQNTALLVTNPDYPPVIPGSGAMAFAVFGRGELLVAIRVTVLLNACAVGVVAVGIGSAGNKGPRLTRLIALLVAGGVCLVAFAVAGDYAVNGFADLLWSAAALGAVVWGLVLPASPRALAVAWTCAMVASLTKNEGLIAALILLILISLRYLPPSLAWVRRPRGGADGQPTLTVERWQSTKEWGHRALYVVVPALPGLIWVGIVHRLGIPNLFFGHSGAQKTSLGARASATVAGMAGHLAVVPVAIVVLVAGSLVLRSYRENLGLGNPLWLWASCLLALAAVFATYVWGSPPIHWWLQSSVDRTTIFAQIALYTELAIWLIVVFGEGGSMQAPLSPPREFEVREESPRLRVGASAPSAGVGADHG